MPQKAATAFLLALASIQLSTAPLLAKPTRPLAHTSARRLIVAEPVPRSSHERPTRERISQTPTPAHPHARGVSGSHAAGNSAPSRPDRNSRRTARTVALDREPASGRSSARLRNTPRSLAQERAFAAEAAIASADRGYRKDFRAEREERPEVKAGHLSRVNYSIERATRESLPKRVAFDRPSRRSDSAASAEETFAASVPSSSAANPTNTNALINVGGLLRTAPGSSPLKSMEEEASTPVIVPPLRVTSLYDSQGRLVVPPPLYGSREILLHQNQMADRDGLYRIQDDADLLDLRREKKLVALPDNETLRVDFRLPGNRRYSRPWTAAFLTILARDYYDSFHSPLQVDSAVRTVAVQQRLIRTNGNAAPSTGDTASPHLTGQAVDIAKGGLSRIQIAWMRTYLQPLIDLGKIDVEEEFQQSCFHISVYKNFVPSSPTRISVAAAPQPNPATLQEGPID